MVNDVCIVRVHPALSVPLRKRMRVLDPVDVEGVIVGFKTQTIWSFRRPTRTSWVIVETVVGGLRSWRSPAELRVVERTAVNHHKQEGQTV